VDDATVFLSKDFQENVMDKFERGILTPEGFRQKVREVVSADVCDQEIDDAWNALLLDIPKERIAVIEQVKQNYQIFLLRCRSNEK